MAGWYRLDLAYEGTPFRGWAKQPGRRTVQGELERALAVGAARARAPARGRPHRRRRARARAGRVVRHAARPLDLSGLLLTLNALLPPDVAVRRVARAADGFDARAARARTYCYRLWLPHARPVFEARYVWDVRGPVDPGLLRGVRAPAGRAPRLRGALALGAPLPHLRAPGDPRPWSLSSDGSEAVFEITAALPAHDGARGRGDHGRRRPGPPVAEQFAEGLAGGERRRWGAPPRRAVWRWSRGLLMTRQAPRRRRRGLARRRGRGRRLLCS